MFTHSRQLPHLDTFAPGRISVSFGCFAGENNFLGFFVSPFTIIFLLPYKSAATV